MLLTWISKFYSFYKLTHICYFCGNKFNTLHTNQDLASFYIKEQAPLQCKNCGMKASW